MILNLIMPTLSANLNLCSPGSMVFQLLIDGPSDMMSNLPYMADRSTKYSPFGSVPHTFVSTSK
jgi:hypothetical protein